MVAAYAAQADAASVKKDQFWMNLGDCISTIPKNENLL